MVDHLVGVARPGRAIDGARDHQQRRALLRRIGDAVHRLGKARPQGGDEQPRRAGQRGMARGHDRSGGLLPGETHGDPGAVERVEQGDDLAPGNGEDRADAVRVERSGDAVGHAGGLCRSLSRKSDGPGRGRLAMQGHRILGGETV